jgi:hypothetical protein
MTNTSIIQSSPVRPRLPSLSTSTCGAPSDRLLDER